MGSDLLNNLRNRKVSFVIASERTKYDAEDYSTFKTLRSQDPSSNTVTKYVHSHLGFVQLTFIGILGVEGMQITPFLQTMRVYSTERLWEVFLISNQYTWVRPKRKELKVSKT